MCACADVLNFKYRDVKIFLLKLGSELQNLIKKFQSVLKKEINKMQIAFPRSGMHIPSKFKRGTPGLLSKFKKETHIMVFPHCFTRYILYEKLRNFLRIPRIFLASL